jgi:hypothetical protein
MVENVLVINQVPVTEVVNLEQLVVVLLVVALQQELAAVDVSDSLHKKNTLISVVQIAKRAKRSAIRLLA